MYFTVNAAYPPFKSAAFCSDHVSAKRSGISTRHFQTAIFHVQAASQRGAGSEVPNLQAYSLGRGVRHIHCGFGYLDPLEGSLPFKVSAVWCGSVAPPNTLLCGWPKEVAYMCTVCGRRTHILVLVANSSDDDAVSLDELWRPHWILLDTAEDPMIRDDVVELGSPGTVQNYHRSRVCFDCSVDLHDFPFDTQQLSIRIRFPRHHTQGIIAVNPAGFPPDDIQLSPQNKHGEFTMRANSACMQIKYLGDPKHTHLMT